MSTSTLLTITICCFLVGIILVGGGIGYLILQNRKERKKSDLRAKQRSLFNNPNICHTPGSPHNPSVEQTNEKSE